MKLEELKPPEGSRKKRKRVGRGIGSGHGKTACKGAKGQKARSGGGIKAGFEGGQMPMQRRLPKRGFRSPFKKRFALLHVKDLNRFPKDTVVEPELLFQSGLLRNKGEAVKLLSDGELQHPLTIRVHQASKAALQKVEAASGRVEVIGFMISGAQNIFKIPELKRRIFWIFRSSGGLSSRCAYPDTRNQRGCVGLLLCPGEGDPLQPHRHVLRRGPGEAFGLRPGHHALYQRLHHPPASDGGDSLSRPPAEGRRDRPEKDRPIYPLWNRGPQHDPGFWNRRRDWRI